MLSQLNLRQTMGKAVTPLGIVGAVGGFVSDVLAPLGSLAPWVSALSFVVFLGAIVAFFRLRKSPDIEPSETIMPAVMVLAAGATIIFAVWGSLFASGPENGYLADNVEGIAQLQVSILGLEEDIAEIQETTEETAEQVEIVATVVSETQETTEEIQEVVEDTAEQVEGVATAQVETQETTEEVQEVVEDTAVQVEIIATTQAEGFADIQEAFANLLANQTVVENPDTPQEWYSNARLFQLRGDTANAIAAYEWYSCFLYVDSGGR